MKLAMMERFFRLFHNLFAKDGELCGGNFAELSTFVPPCRNMMASGETE
jgi:hypothetical protein